jgi:hypothetical protein
MLCCYQIEGGPAGEPRCPFAAEYEIRSFLGGKDGFLAGRPIISCAEHLADLLGGGSMWSVIRLEQNDTDIDSLNDDGGVA